MFSSPRQPYITCAASHLPIGSLGWLHVPRLESVMCQYGCFFFTEIFLSVAVRCSDALAISKNKSTCFRGGSAWCYLAVTEAPQAASPRRFSCFKEWWMSPSTAEECAWGGRWRCTTSKGENYLGCPSRAERSRVSLCEKCRPTLHTAYLTLLPLPLLYLPALPRRHGTGAK